MPDRADQETFRLLTDRVDALLETGRWSARHPTGRWPPGAPATDLECISLGTLILRRSLRFVRGSDETLVMWCVWSPRGAYEPEFGGLSRDRLGSRQNRDRIGPEPGDLATAHGPVRVLVRGARSTATGPDPVDFGLCLDGTRACPRGQVV